MSASPGTRLRCSICARFARQLVAGGRCEPCAGVLPLDFTPRSAVDPAGLARLCVELGEHDWDDASDPCECGQPHPFRICARCLVVDESDCAGGVR